MIDIDENATEHRLILGIKDNKNNNNTWNEKIKIKIKIILTAFFIPLNLIRYFS